MSKNEIVEVSKKNTSFDKIMRFMSDGDVVLSANDEEILHRWIFCHKQMLQRKFTEVQIIDKIVENFGISSYTARNDIYQAQALFGSTIKANKKYLLYNHAENILLTIEKFSNDKSLKSLLPKLFDSYTKAVSAIPEEINRDKQPPPMMNFFILPGQQVTSVKTFEEALANLTGKNNTIDIDHEDIEQ
jgi:hypothetical protein